MTVSSENSRNSYTGDGVTTVFPYTFELLDQTEIQVLDTDPVTNVITTKTLTTDYSVSGVGIGTGGNITFVSAPGSGHIIVFLRNMHFLQQTHYREFDSFPAISHETAIDRLTMISQQLKEDSGRNVTLSPSVSGVNGVVAGIPSAYNIIRINASANGLEYASPASIGTYAFPGTNGILVQNAAGSAETISITGTANQITVTNGNGIAGNPTISLPTSLTFTGFTVTNGTYNSPTISSATISGATISGSTLTGSKADLFKDTNGNSALTLTATTNAVNAFTFANATTNNAPTINMTGSDSAIGLDVVAKGANAYLNVKTTNGVTNAAGVRISQASSTGSNRGLVTVQAGLTADRTYTLPDTDIGNWIVQRVNTETGAVATGTTQIPLDDTIPQITEGDQYMSLSITPKNTANILKIEITANISTNTNGTTMTAALFQDSTSNALAASITDISTSGQIALMRFSHIMTAGTTSATTFKVRIGGGQASTTTFNGSGGSRKLGGILASSIVITEYAA